MGVIASCCIPQDQSTDTYGESRQHLISKRKRILSASVLTWNVDAKLPNESIDGLFKHKQFDSDIVIVGLQEVIELNATNLVMDNHETEDALWKSKIEMLLNHKEKNKYVCLESIDLVGILLLVFVKSTIHSHLHNVASEKCATGFLGIGGNKGAVGIRFDVFGTRICVICCHLAAHKTETAARNENYYKIINELKFIIKNEQNLIDVEDQKEFVDEMMILDHDIVFVFGDLNYRLNYDADELQNVYGLIKKRKWKALLSNDQLLNAMQNNEAFSGFCEHKIKFQPTFKFEPGTNDYEEEKKRIPSYCDRILWRCNDVNIKVSCIKYDAFVNQKMSDHKPVFGLFQLNL